MSRPRFISPRFHWPEPGDRIGQPQRKDGSACFATHLVRVQDIVLDAGRPSSVPVVMSDGLGTKFRWKTSRVRDAEGEELSEGATYLLSGDEEGQHCSTDHTCA